MNRYDELSAQYSSVYEKNIAYKNQIGSLAGQLKDNVTEYLGCDNTLLHFINFAEGSKACTLEESLFFDEESQCWIFGLGVEMHSEKGEEYPILEMLLPVSVYKNKEVFIVDIGKNIFVLDAKESMQAVNEKILELLTSMIDNLSREKRQEHKPTIGFIREIKKQEV